MQGNTWVTKSFEWGLAVRTFDSLVINGLMAPGTVRHDGKRGWDPAGGDRERVRVSSLLEPPFVSSYPKYLD